MNANAIPIIGWILDLLVKISLALPFWIVWTVLGIGEKYAYGLPEVYHAPGFWNTVGVFICAGILKSFSPFVVNSKSESKEGPLLTGRRKP